MTTALTFELATMDVTASMTTSPSFFAAPTATVSADAVANYDFASAQSSEAAAIRALFQFKTDSDLLTDDALGTDIEYQIAQANGANKKLATVGATTGEAPNFAASDALVVQGDAIVGYADGTTNAGTPSIEYDLVRHIAKEVTGVSTGVDIFDNEEDLRSNVVSIDSAVLTSIDAQLAAQTDNVCDTILRQLLNTTDRKNAVLAAIAAANEGDFVTMPLIAGDKIAFKLTYTPVDDNSTKASGSIATRSYKVVVTL